MWGVPSGSPPSAWKAKGELDAVLSMPKEGIVVPYYLFPFQQAVLSPDAVGKGDKGDGIPIKNKSSLYIQSCDNGVSD